jgi:beta-lactamase class A
MRSIAIILVCGCGHSLGAQIDARIRKQHDAELVAVAFQDLQSGETFVREADRRVHAASTMKLPVMMEVYRRSLALDEPVAVDNHFRSLYDSSDFQLDPNDDADPQPYQKIGQQVPLRWLVERMIVRSSNLATNIVIQLVGAEAVTSMCRTLGAQAIEVRRGVEDSKAHAAGMDNTTTARDLMVLLRAIGEHRVPGADDMIGVLSRQELNEGIPAGLPPLTKVAHKTGSFGGIYHDAALVLADRPYVLVILTRGIADEKQAAQLVADLSRLVWQHRAH